MELNCSKYAISTLHLFVDCPCIHVPLCSKGGGGAAKRLVLLRNSLLLIWEDAKDMLCEILCKLTLQTRFEGKIVDCVSRETLTKIVLSSFTISRHSSFNYYYIPCFLGKL